MKTKKSTNYLRAFRRRLGISQSELAYLLGSATGTKVSRYECYSREPKLRTILALEAVFDVPARELFRNMYLRIESQILVRAQTLVSRLPQTTLTPRQQRAKGQLANMVKRGSLIPS